MGRHPRFLGMTAQPTLGVKLARVRKFAYPNPSWFYQARDSFQWYGMADDGHDTNATASIVDTPQLVAFVMVKLGLCSSWYIVVLKPHLQPLTQNS